MLSGSWKTATIALNGQTSAEVDLDRQWERLLLVAPALDNAQISLEVAEKTGGTFQDLYMILDADGTSAQIITDTTTTAKTYILPLGGFQFVKIKASAAQTGGARAFRVCGIRS